MQIQIMRWLKKDGIEVVDFALVSHVAQPTMSSLCLSCTSSNVLAAQAVLIPNNSVDEGNDGQILDLSTYKPAGHNYNQLQEIHLLIHLCLQLKVSLSCDRV